MKKQGRFHGAGGEFGSETRSRNAEAEAQRILGRAKEEAAAIQQEAEAEAQRLSAGLAEQAAARRGDAIDAVKRLLFA